MSKRVFFSSLSVITTASYLFLFNENCTVNRLIQYQSIKECN